MDKNLKSIFGEMIIMAYNSFHRNKYIGYCKSCDCICRIDEVKCIKCNNPPDYILESTKALKYLNTKEQLECIKKVEV